MGCTQSKAKENQTTNTTAENPQNANEVPNENNHVNDKNENQNEENQETHTPVVRKELDIKPPPVKAIPKIAPKAIPKKGN